MNPVRMTNVCMVEPAAFGFNAETARSNRFQRDAGLPAAQAAAAARVESAALASALRAAGIGVAIAADTSDPPKPDAVFPNNWVSFHADGTVVLYPMFNPSRRAERREAVIDCVKAQLGFVETRRLDLTAEETTGDSSRARRPCAGPCQPHGLRSDRRAPIRRWCANGRG
jgi:hypothetical protein